MHIYRHTNIHLFNLQQYKHEHMYAYAHLYIYRDMHIHIHMCTHIYLTLLSNDVHIGEKMAVTKRR